MFSTSMRVRSCSQSERRRERTRAEAARFHLVQEVEHVLLKQRRGVRTSVSCRSEWRGGAMRQQRAQAQSARLQAAAVHGDHDGGVVDVGGGRLRCVRRSARVNKRRVRTTRRHRCEGCEWYRKRRSERRACPERSISSSTSRARYGLQRGRRGVSRARWLVSRAASATRAARCATLAAMPRAAAPRAARRVAAAAAGRRRRTCARLRAP